MAATHVREYRSPLAGPEKRLLVWMAERLPGWIHSDHLTLLGLSSMLGAGLAFWAARWHRGALPLVVVALVLNWLGDSLDGTVARVRDQQRPRYGYYMVSAEVFLATPARGVFRMAFLGFGPTELRVVLAAGTLLLLRDPWVRRGDLGPYSLFDVGGLVAIAGLALALVSSAVRNTRALYLVDTGRQ